MKKSLYCGFITQRPNALKWGFDEENEDFIKLKRVLKHQIFSLVDSGVENFITSLSQGIETVCAEIILELKENLNPNIRLVCALPFEEQAGKWSSHQRERYFTIMEKADKSIFLQEKFSQDCFINAFDWTLYYSQYMVAVFDDLQRNSTGIMYCKALKKRKYIISINPYSLQVEEIHTPRNQIAVCEYSGCNKVACN